ncbi:MAG: T9SS type A sorting domain-containing protein [Dysgonamonadaceae bacterium]|jgi:hypothetical protein|nr:T9SS type A sorting domain-containing protein [Dysgonamonadaceae bacterium]
MKRKYLSVLFFSIACFPAFAVLPDSIKNGSDFYIFYMDNASQNTLGSKVKVPKMIRDYDVWSFSLDGDIPFGVAGAWGELVINKNDSYTAFRVKEGGAWNGGAIVAKLNEFSPVPDLTPVTDNADDYYFHFAIKSPIDQQDAGLILIFYSDSTPSIEEGGGLKYYAGPVDVTGQVDNGTWRPNSFGYAHDGQWHHFEIPVSQMKDGEYRYQWTKPLHTWGEDNGRVYLLGFQSLPHVPGTEINLDAMFFYKKPAGAAGGITPPSVESNTLSVYPNPADNTLYIKGGGNVAARIHDLTGKTVLSRVLSKPEIDVSGLSRGLYFLTVNNRTVKFIKN